MELLSRKEIAKELKVSTRTIDRMIKEDTIPRYLIGGAWKFNKNEVLASAHVKRRLKQTIVCPYCGYEMK